MMKQIMRAVMRSPGVRHFLKVIDVMVNANTNARILVIVDNMNLTTDGLREPNGGGVARTDIPPRIDRKFRLPRHTAYAVFAGSCLQLSAEDGALLNALERAVILLLD